MESVPFRFVIEILLLLKIKLTIFSLCMVLSIYLSVLKLGY